MRRLAKHERPAVVRRVSSEEPRIDSVRLTPQMKMITARELKARKEGQEPRMKRRFLCVLCVLLRFKNSDGLSGLPADLLLDVGLGDRAFGGIEGAALDDVPAFANNAGPGVGMERPQDPPRSSPQLQSRQSGACAAGCPPCLRAGN